MWLKEQFPAKLGLQDLAVFQSQECQRVGTPKGKFVLILHVGTLGYGEYHSLPSIRMDSFFYRVRGECKEKFLKQLGWLLFTDAQYISIKFVNVQKQQGSVTRVLFALAMCQRSIILQ